MKRWVIFGLAVSALSGCATTGWPTAVEGQSPAGAPEAFVVDGPAGTEASSPVGACRSPLRDPRDGTRLTLVRSQAGQGDYEVEGAKYGLSAGQLLRVDCRNGQPLGVVER